MKAWVSSAVADGTVLELKAGGGTATAFSMQSPDKSSGNEDTVAVIDYAADSAILIVADGAGGLPAAQQASQTAVASLLESLDAAALAGEALMAAIPEAITSANAAVMRGTRGSATTLTIIAIEQRVGRCFHVGDSVALVTGQRGKIRFQSISHSPVSYAQAAGLLTEDQAMFHIDRHIVSNFVGNPEMHIDCSPAFTLAARDTVLVCSDGLSDNLKNQEIIDTMRCGPLPNVLPDLIQTAMERMLGIDPQLPCKPDDLSLIVFRK